MAFVYISLLHCHVCRVIAWVGKHVDFGIWKTTYWPEVALNWRREWGLEVNWVKSRALKMADFVCISHVLQFSYHKFYTVKNFSYV